MKSIRNITLLFMAVAAIVIFWLAPGINTAKDTEYVRRYEDTDRRALTVAVRDTTGAKKENGKAAARTKKVYKEERIRSSDKLSKITPSKFSRALQFEEMIEAPADTLVLTEETEKVAP